LTQLDHRLYFPEKTKDERLLHNLVFLIPALGIIAFFFFRNWLWLITAIVGHLLAKVMYLESRIFTINNDQYHKLRQLAFKDAIPIPKKTFDDE
jgi:hypothetical protein